MDIKEQLNNIMKRISNNNFFKQFFNFLKSRYELEFLNDENFISVDFFIEENTYFIIKISIPYDISVSLLLCKEYQITEPKGYSIIKKVIVEQNIFKNKESFNDVKVFYSKSNFDTWKTFTIIIKLLLANPSLFAYIDKMINSVKYPLILSDYLINIYGSDSPFIKEKNKEDILNYITKYIQRISYYFNYIFEKRDSCFYFNNKHYRLQQKEEVNISLIKNTSRTISFSIKDIDIVQEIIFINKLNGDYLHNFSIPIKDFSLWLWDNIFSRYVN